MMNGLRFVCAAIVFATSSAAAQDQMGTTQRAALDKLAWLEGEWRGPAWMMMGPNLRRTADQWEKIYRAAGGTVLVIQGIGKMTNAGAMTGTVAHDALAVIYWDVQRNQYTLRSFVANGSTLETKAEVSDRKVMWGFEHPQAGLMRYTITLTPAGEWREVGEMSPDKGTTWVQSMEMTLKKQ
jgi:hypothetical protein